MRRQHPRQGPEGSDWTYAGGALWPQKGSGAAADSRGEDPRQEEGRMDSTHGGSIQWQRNAWSCCWLKGPTSATRGGMDRRRLRSQHRRITEKWWRCWTGVPDGSGCRPPAAPVESWFSHPLCQNGKAHERSPAQPWRARGNQQSMGSPRHSSGTLSSPSRGSQK